MSEWLPVPLGSLCTVFDGPHATPKKTDKGAWFLSISSLVSGRLEISLSSHISEEDYPRWAKRVTPQFGDTLFSYETRIGESAFWDREDRAVLGRRMGLLRPDTSKVDPRFLSLAYQSPLFQTEIRARTIHGATVNRLPIGEMGNWPIFVPPLEEQRRIAGVLGALDDLIDTNERLAKKCDELCGSAYQREVTNRAVRHERLFDVADITLGGTPSRKIDDYWNGDIPWLNSGVANQFRVLRAEEHISEIGLQKSSAKVFSAGSTLLAITGATLGQISRTEINACGNQSLIAITGQTRALNDWIFLAMRDSIGRLLSHATGAAQQHINKQNVIEFEIPVLSADALEHFGKLISPLFDAVKDLLVEAEQLRSSRDELLPLLMSGKIRVREAEEVVASLTKDSA